MTFHGVFIGINRHTNPCINELVAACDDAKALWAIFADTFPDLHGTLLLDGQATFAGTRAAILECLEQAGAEDTVVISFAGHGSADGRLVMHDTLLADLDNTSLKMSEIADAFSRSRARSVLCVLDCCFSGHAPARVLETPGLSRAAFVLPVISGEGRILLSACGATESAWEQPGGGHGLLTFALLEALTNEGQDQVAFPDVVGEIIRIARTEAARMGHVQTPEFAGRVQGGLTFPRFVKGARYEEAFPKTDIPRLSGPFEELLHHGVPASIVDEWTAKFPGGLNELQLSAVNDFGVLVGNSLMVIAPTSSGKTMIGELAAVQSVLRRRKAVFLLPYKALVNEKFDEFTARFASAGLRIKRCSGDNSDQVGEVIAGRYDICFFTYEMFLGLALGSPRLSNQLGLVVVDEGQFITDPTRGIVVELILALLQRGKEQGIAPQLLILSAVIGNTNAFDQWLGVPLLRSEKRPVPLVEGVIARNGSFLLKDADGNVRTEALIPPQSIRQRRDEPSAQDVIVPLVRKLIGDGEKVIVFRNTRGPAEGCANYLAEELTLPPAASVLAALPNHDLSSTSTKLRNCLRGGSAFHNANLSRAEREAVERGFRGNGGIAVLASTTTLAAGINTPASTVILAENEFIGEDNRPFTVAEYKNMAGRAGRLGFNETGKSIIYAATSIEQAALFAKYVMGRPEDITSSFKDEDMPTWIMRLLSQVRGGIPRAQIPSLLVNTFGGYTASRRDPEWVRRRTTEIDGLVGRLLALGLAEVDGEAVNLSLLGRACGASSLSFESSLRLVELMRGFDLALGPMEILGRVHVLQELDDTYTPIMKKGQRESVRPAEVSSRYGVAMARTLQRQVPDTLTYYQRCKRAAIVFDWIAGVPVEEIERRFSPNFIQGAISYGDIVRITEATRYHLTSALRIFEVLFPDAPDLISGLTVILDRLELGLPNEALGLRDLPIGLSRGQYLALWRAGCRSPEDVHALAQARLAELVGADVAKVLVPRAAAG